MEIGGVLEYLSHVPRRLYLLWLSLTSKKRQVQHKYNHSQLPDQLEIQYKTDENHEKDTNGTEKDPLFIHPVEDKRAVSTFTDLLTQMTYCRVIVLFVLDALPIDTSAVCS